jgi:hypothetical protein
MAKPERAPERIEQISPDLPYELQSRLFEQLTTLSLGGVGLTITLSGTILRSEPLTWISTFEFGLAALFALSAQQTLINYIFQRKPVQKRSRVMTVLCTLLIGMGAGSLGAAVFLNASTATLVN